MRKKLRSFTDLTVWQLASKFSKEMAQLVKIFPRHERYALADDFLRAARSIPANISEGFGRYHPADKVRFYNIASASADECSNHLIEALNNAYIDQKTNELSQKKLHIIAIKLTNLITSTRNRIKQSGTKWHVFNFEKMCLQMRSIMSSAEGVTSSTKGGVSPALHAKACLQPQACFLPFLH